MEAYETIMNGVRNASFTITLTLDDAKKCYHEGVCDNDVNEVCQQEYVKKQMEGLSIHDVADVLNNYGCEYDDGDSIEELFSTCVWLAAGDILDDVKEGIFTKLVTI